jgi:hypothetical protein
MLASLQNEGTPPPSQGYLPTTFLARGVAVPFTTPQLAGARARPGERSALELILPSPSGGSGIYILRWDGLAVLCNPTLHDRRLSAAIAALRGVTPSAIRGAAHDVAAEGFAGRPALAAALAAAKADEQARLLASFDLLLQLVRQVEPPGENSVAPEADRPAALEQRARRALARIAPGLGCAARELAANLEELAVPYGAIGIRRSGRVPKLIADLVRLRREVAEYAAANPDDHAREAALIVCAAGLTIGCAKATLADAQALSVDLVDLLRRWRAEPDALAARLARPDWLLDGWERMCALWRVADARTNRGATLAEIAELLPVVPSELGDWVKELPDVDPEAMRYRRKVTVLQDWRTGVALLDLIARNESLLAYIA